VQTTVARLAAVHVCAGDGTIGGSVFRLPMTRSTVVKGVALKKSDSDLHDNRCFFVETIKPV